MWLQIADAAGVVRVAGQIRARAVGEHQDEGHGIGSASVRASSARLNRVEVLAGAVLAVSGQPLDDDAGMTPRSRAEKNRHEAGSVEGLRCSG